MDTPCDAQVFRMTFVCGDLLLRKRWYLVTTLQLLWISLCLPFELTVFIMLCLWAMFTSGMLHKGKDLLRTLHKWYELHFQIPLMEPWEKAITHCFALLLLYLSTVILRILFTGLVIIFSAMLQFSRDQQYWSIQASSDITS